MRLTASALVAACCALTALLAAVCPPPAQAAGAELAHADALWTRRADGQENGRPRPERASAVVAAYEQARAAEPERLEPAWKLQRALWFAGEFAGAESAAERRSYERALAVAQVAFAKLAAQFGGSDALASLEPDALRARLEPEERRDAASLYFWYAINLGAWSRLAGLVQAVRTGVANRLHEAALRSLALDPDIEQGGALRLLSRLHSELPRVPWLSGWVDPSLAVPLAERALTEYPTHPGNAYLLGLSLFAEAPARRDDALRLIEATAALEPRPDHIIEDLAIRIDAGERHSSEGS